MEQVKISIITITYNSERTVEETLKSVISQAYPNLEYIIVDGASKDKTLDVVAKYKDSIARIISEPDKGIADAFNKGIRMATGDLIGIINSDDLLLPGALRKMAESYDGETDVYRGNTVISNLVSQFRCREIPSMKFPTVPYTIHMAHPSTFVSRNAYQKYGVFDLDFRYIMDLELLCRFYRLGATFKYVDADIAEFRIGGATSDSIAKKKNDLFLLIRKNGGTTLQAWSYYSFLRLFDCGKRVLNFLFGEDFKRKLRYRK